MADSIEEMTTQNPQKLFIITVENTNGTKNTLSEPCTAEQITNILSNILNNSDFRITAIKPVSDKYVTNKILKWFIESMSDEDNIQYIDAIFKEKNDTIWPFDLIDEEEIPENINNDDYEKIAKWVWNESNVSQKDHIKKLYKMFS